MKTHATAPRWVVIVGGCAGAKIAYDILALSGFQVLGFLNNFTPKDNWGTIRPKLLGEADDPQNVNRLRLPEVEYFVATGENALREKLTNHLIELTGKRPINAIHPTAIISDHTVIGRGNLICAGVCMNTGAEIGNGTILNTGSVVEHDNRVGDYAQIGPQAALAGYVTIESRAFVGTGATIIPHITVGEDAIVAAGATVIHAVEKKTMVAGCPAKVKKVLD